MTPEQLKQRREALSLSRARLSELLGVSPKTVETWEYGTRPIPNWLPLAFTAVEFTHNK